MTDLPLGLNMGWIPDAFSTVIGIIFSAWSIIIVLALVGAVVTVLIRVFTR